MFLVFQIVCLSLSYCLKGSHILMGDSKSKMCCESPPYIYLTSSVNCEICPVFSFAVQVVSVI